MIFGHVHPSEMGCHGVVREGNCVLEWHSLGQIVVESYLFLVGSGVDVNSRGGGIFVMAWTLRGSIVILLWEMMNPRRRLAVTQNMHLRGFKWMLY
jgi:hypothetical protein